MGQIYVFVPAGMSGDISATLGIVGSGKRKRIKGLRRLWRWEGTGAGTARPGTRGRALKHPGQTLAQCAGKQRIM